MNGVLQSRQQKTNEFTFHGGLIRFDRAEVSEIESIISQAQTLTDSLDDLVSDLSDEVENIDDQSKKVARKLKAAITLCEINDLPDTFKTAFLGILASAQRALKPIRKCEIGHIQADIAATLFTNRIEE